MHLYLLRRLMCKVFQIDNRFKPLKILVIFLAQDFRFKSRIKKPPRPASFLNQKM